MTTSFIAKVVESGNRQLLLDPLAIKIDRSV